MNAAAMVSRLDKAQFTYHANKGHLNTLRPLSAKLLLQAALGLVAVSTCRQLRVQGVKKPYSSVWILYGHFLIALINNKCSQTYQQT